MNKWASLFVLEFLGIIRHCSHNREGMYMLESVKEKSCMVNLGEWHESTLYVVKTAGLTLRAHSSSFSHHAMLHLHYYEVSLTRIAGCWKHSWLPRVSLCKLTQLQRLWRGSFFFFFTCTWEAAFEISARSHFILHALKQVNVENTS